ncbi:transporter substrate-binding domain-containing protein [Okeania sp. SIO2B3]|uniref:transporter substrate-binding domain-containing protein n=1 Tax=Okeania sp. SIO2B3 TaxID=2607784 RepID=UPI0025D09138|nr:transporter substrate-binding domain-containing protein [Okeania sp. SIO2B3]
MNFFSTNIFKQITSKVQLLTLLSITLISLFPLSARATKLRVGVAGSPPFVIKDRDFKGISIDIWQELSSLEGLEYELYRQESVNDGIDNILRGELDLVIGPISVTSDRLERVAFTQPYFLANIGLLISGERPKLWSRLQPFFGLAFMSSVGLLVVLLFTVGNLLWLAERRRNTEQFPKDYWNGIGNGMWFALVTLTTVGYGDRAPITKAGRIIAGVWMMITMVTVSSLTAGIATSLTLSLSDQTVVQFTAPEDIKNSRIAVVRGSTGEKWAQLYGSRISQTRTLVEAIDLVRLNEVDGVVFDTPALKYYLHTNPNENLKLSPVTFASESYGFMISPDSSFLEDFNIRILEMRESGKIREIESQWLSY